MKSGIALRGSARFFFFVASPPKKKCSLSQEISVLK